MINFINRALIAALTLSLSALGASIVWLYLSLILA